jgi:hypothetical protein
VDNILRFNKLTCEIKSQTQVSNPALGYPGPPKYTIASLPPSIRYVESPCLHVRPCTRLHCRPAQLDLRVMPVRFCGITALPRHPSQISRESRIVTLLMCNAPPESSTNVLPKELIFHILVHPAFLICSMHVGMCATVFSLPCAYNLRMWKACSSYFPAFADPSLLSNWGSGMDYAIRFPHECDG